MESKSNLENVLHDVNRFINIDSQRQKYAAHFENLKNVIFNKLRENEVFGYLFNGFQLAGGYGDNVKVSLPDEFDLVFHIKFPEYPLIIVKKDDKCPGNVQLDFTKVLLKIANEKQHEKNLRHLRKWLNDENFLKVDNFQSFIHSCFTTVLQDMKYCIVMNKELATLRYTREGPAHTIHVTGKFDLVYSVDFVPGILLNEQQSVMLEPTGQWEAIPKPYPIHQPNYTSFRSSYYRQEYKIIQNKLSLKNVLRMMKKFRDSHQNMNKMKSYFIKTHFLWKAKQEDNQYWRRHLTEIIIDMFKSMEKSLQDKHLPFFWDKRLNLYQHYSNELYGEMLKCLKSARETLEKAATQMTIPLQKRVYRIFLCTDERNQLENGSVNLIPISSDMGSDNNDLDVKENKSQCKIL